MKMSKLLRRRKAFREFLENLAVPLARDGVLSPSDECVSPPTSPFNQNSGCVDSQPANAAASKV